MKIFKIFLLIILVISFGCNEGYIDEISSVDPGEDKSSPSVSLSNPNGDINIPFTETETDIEFRFGASDDIELQSVTLSLNGSELITVTDFIDYRQAERRYVFEDAPIGDHTVEVVATDLSGKTTTETLDFEVTNQYQAMDGELFYMPFEGSSYTDLIGDLEGTPSGNPEFVDGVSFDALEFDVANQSYLTVPSSVLSGVNSWSVSFWTNVNFVDEDDNGAIDGVLGLIGFSNVGRFWGNLDVFIENNSNPTDGARMRLHITNGMDPETPDYSETWISSLNDVSGIFDQWAHHVLVYDDVEDEFKYYVNNMLLITADATWGDSPFAFVEGGPMVMGCVQFQTDPSLTSATSSQTWASYLTGEIDEVKIFNKPLSENEVSDLYTPYAP